MTPRAALRSLVWNADERRPPAPLRLVALVAAVFVALLAAGFLVVPLRGGGIAAGGAVGTVASGVAVTAGVLAVARVVDRRRLADLGLRAERGWVADLLAGLGLGVALQTLVAGVGLLAGWFRLVDTTVGAPAAFAGAVVLYLAVGFYEELLLRGYLLTNAAEALSGYLDDRAAAAGALLVSAAVFGVAHWANPGASPLSTLGVALAGVFLGVGYVLTGRLSFPVGVHVTWNFTQGVVYGLPVSGTTAGAHLLDLEPVGPPLVTGGAFGPEAGLLGVAALVVGTAATVAWDRRTGDGRLDPRVLVPDLRWRAGESADERGGEAAAEVRRRDR
ncbi:CPBP family intramembrane glutamic endopeptidase [Candidatus Halobonum tyrrellensis]|uniref:Caax amino terminal protease n=1 Tax=Candidatus Halobonum tyrrellensis G22 TaxID=1324957 RepID=V4IXL6_9EURY|nr:CPBP family intramembrane glutamic endopeptidase [Candidatus Halobonum tyrrellensis]ESP87902.1 caax amino terminal protease [Candidatus Halobonum tyrrellensis G22]